MVVECNEIIVGGPGVKSEKINGWRACLLTYLLTYLLT